MRFLRQSMIGLFLAAATLGLLAYAMVIVQGAVSARMEGARPAPPQRERVFAVNVIRAEPGREIPVLETFGEVQSRRRLELRAATPGKVIWLSDGFEDGGTVTTGDVLVRLDPADAQAAVDRMRNDLQDAEAEGRDAARAMTLAQDELAAAEDQVELRERAYQRQVDLTARGVSTAAATETAELAVSTARASVLSRRQALAQAQTRVDGAATRLSRSRIALAEAERRLADTTIAAPFSGTLAETAVVEGRLVTGNERLAELIDPDDLEVSFRISTAQYARLLDAQGALIKAPVTITLDVAGVDITAQGRISRASAGAGEGQTGRLVFAAMGQAAGFKPGDFVTVAVEEPALERVVRLPASALSAASEVLVLGEDDRLESLKVRLLRRQGDDVLVTADALAGREVVRALTPLLGAGIAVRPLRGQNTAIPDAPALVELTDERRARLVAFVEANQRMPKAAKEQVLARLAEPMVPAKMVERIESRMGG